MSMLEKKLKDQARRKGMTGERAETYVIDNMSRRLGWTPEEKKDALQSAQRSKAHDMRWEGERWMQDGERMMKAGDLAKDKSLLSEGKAMFVKGKDQVDRADSILKSLEGPKDAVPVGG